ncbi:MAG: pseudouridine synthase [Myxococcota bacterium]
MSSPPPPVEILHRDARLVVVHKPSGLAVHKGWARDPHYAMTVTRDAIGQRVYTVHRLDRATSGALVFALDSEGAGVVQRAFREQRVTKRYLALVRGIPPREGTVDHALKKRKGEAETLPAQTDFRRLWIFRRRYSLVEAWPRTGRTHQVRRHLRHLSCPIVGDVNYGDGRHNRLFRSEHDLHRLALHAAEIVVPHPETGEDLAVQAPLPDDLRGPLERIGAPADLLP